MISDNATTYVPLRVTRVLNHIVCELIPVCMIGHVPIQKGEYNQLNDCVTVTADPKSSGTCVIPFILKAWIKLGRYIFFYQRRLHRFEPETAHLLAFLSIEHFQLSAPRDQRWYATINHPPSLEFFVKMPKYVL